MSIAEEMKKLERRSEIPAFLKREGLNGTVIEVGVRYGYNFELMLSSNPRLAIAVDHWKDTGVAGDQDKAFTQSKLDQIYSWVAARYLQRKSVKILRMSSRLACGLFPLFSVDYVYIDANHTQEGCLQDMELWWNRVRQGGILAGHDYKRFNAQDGTPIKVIDAVNEFVANHRIPKELFHFTPAGCRSWMIFKDEGE